MILRTVVIWFLLMILAIGNAGIRAAVFTPKFGEQTGHVISTVSLCLIIFIVSWFSIVWINPASARAAFFVGLIWFVMTISFEFLAGHYLFGNSWDRLFADYNVLKGRIWSFVLITNLLSPWIMYSLRKMR
jgi:hypothetical protein